MKTLLRIDCSSRVQDSHSRELADYFEEKWKIKHPHGAIKYRDLTKLQIPHIQNKTIEGFYTPKEQMSLENKKATALSDKLIEELKSSDEIVISSPLYNLNIPSNLKAYFDQVVRIRHTFDINKNGYYGLLMNKIAYLITVKGGTYKGTPMETLDFQEPYLKAILNHMGIRIQELFSLEGTSDSETTRHNKLSIQQDIHQLFEY